MMRSRGIREGGVGLLILGGVASFAGLFLWLYNLRPNTQGYRFVVSFNNVGGLAEGSAVRLRGVEIGRVDKIIPQADSVKVTAFIDSEIPIPRDSEFMTRQTGLVGETVMDIRPQSGTQALNSTTPPPRSTNCDPKLIVCDGQSLEGAAGVDYAQLITTLNVLARRIDNDELFANINKSLKGVTTLTEDTSKLSRTINSKVQALNTEQLDLAKFTAAAESVQNTADRFTKLVDDNSPSLQATLANVQKASADLQAATNAIRPMLTDPELQTSLKRVLENAATASENAAMASADLQKLSASISDPGTIATLRQTLDSARATFQNTQKITADLDELTGDPKFRQNLRKLVDGLGGLVSAVPSTDPSAASVTALNLQAFPPADEVNSSYMLAPASIQPLTPQAFLGMAQP